MINKKKSSDFYLNYYETIIRQLFQIKIFKCAKTKFKMNPSDSPLMFSPENQPNLFPRGSNKPDLFSDMPPLPPAKQNNLEPSSNLKLVKFEVSPHLNFHYPLVKKFVEKLKSLIFFSSISSLTYHNRQILNDRSYIEERKMTFPNWAKSHTLKKMIKLTLIVRRIIDSAPVINPYDNIKFFWDLIHFVALFFLIFWIPIEICFDNSLPNGLNDFFLILFIMDIAVNLNTAYFLNGFIVKDRNSIYRQYAKNFLIWDVLTIIAFGIDHPLSLRKEHDLSHQIYFVLKFVFFLRMRNFVSIYSRFIERLNAKYIFKDSFVAFVNLSFISIFILHIFACFWFFIADINLQNPDVTTWLHKLDLLEEDTTNTYMYSLYWSSVTIMTVGYGDISPQNNYEVWFTIFAVFFGCGVVAYIISAIGNIMIDFNKDNQIFK